MRTVATACMLWKSFRQCCRLLLRGVSIDRKCAGDRDGRAPLPRYSAAGNRSTGEDSLGASGWDYYVPYQPDRYAAFVALRQRVFESGEFWWAVPGEPGKMARDYPNRPQTEDELWAEESVRLAGTHSILDMYRVL